MSEQSGPAATSQPLLSFWGDGRRAMRRVFPSLLVYESVWKVLIWMVLGPLGLALLQAAIRLSGDVAVANTEIVSFALTPLGFVTLLIMATVMLSAMFFERAGLYYLLHHALNGRRMSSWHAFAATLRAGGRILGVALAQVGLFLVVLVPFVVILALAYKMLLTTFDINYYLAQQPRPFKIAVVVGSAVGLIAAVTLAYLYVRWAFAVPAALFEGKPFVQALRGSAQLVKGFGWKVFAAVLSWELFRFAFYWLVFLGLKWANELILRWLEHSSGNVLGWVAGLMIVDMLIFAGIHIFETIVFCLVVTLLYENLRRRQTEPVPLINEPARAMDRYSGRVVLASLTVMLVAVGLVAWQMVALARTFKERGPDILVTAHRAGAEAAPENTLEALRQAIDDGADYAEIDVQRTKASAAHPGGVVVVLHDRDLKRLTGDKRNIWDITYEDLKKLSYLPAKKPRGKEPPVYTLKALRQAVDQGAYYAEIEVQRTKDGVVVALHDKDLKRLAGDKRNIWDITYEDLNKLTYLTKKKSGKGKEPTVDDVKIATLEEFIEAARDNIKLNIELKYYKERLDKELAGAVVKILESQGVVDQCVITSQEAEPLKEVRKFDPSLVEDVKIATLEEFINTAKDKIKLNIELKYYKMRYDKDLAKVVVDMLQRLEFENECVITSLEPKALKEVRELNPNLKTGIIVAAELGNLTLYEVNFLSLKGKLVDADLRYLASRKQLQIHAWEVETRADMEMMIHLGVDNLITDRPKLAIEVRSWYNGLSESELILFHFRTWLRS